MVFCLIEENSVEHAFELQLRKLSNLHANTKKYGNKIFRDCLINRIAFDRVKGGTSRVFGFS